MGLPAFLCKGLVARLALSGVWELSSWSVPGQRLTDKSGSLCLDSINNMVNGELKVYAEHLLSSGNLEFGHLLDRGCLCDQTLAKILAAESLMGFPECNSCTYVVAFVLLEEKCALCKSSWDRRNIRKRSRGFLHTSPMSFSLMIWMCIFKISL